jgi:hypothetical protein
MRHSRRHPENGVKSEDLETVVRCIISGVAPRELRLSAVFRAYRKIALNLVQQSVKMHASGLGGARWPNS